MTILVVEDDKLMGELLERMLEPLGVKVILVKELSLGFIEMTRVPPPDLIILDLGLPDSQSPDTVNRIPEIQKLNPNAPIIVLTGNTEEKIEQAARALKVDEYIIKPHMNRQADTYQALWKVIHARMAKGQTMNEAVTAVYDRLNTLVNEKAK